MSIAEDRIKRLKQQAKNEDLMILAWGPSDPGSGGPALLQAYWRKRNQIREQLKAAFPNAEVYFSEDVQLRQYTTGLKTPLEEEFLHAAAADCILVLDLSRGAHVEVDRFTMNPVIARKMTVLIPDRYVGGTGLVSAIHDETNVSGFSDEDFDTCRLAREMAVQIVEAVAINRLLQSPY